jgi:hypothetical protein
MVTCPACHRNINFHVDVDIIKRATRLPVAISIKHCDKRLIAYIDADFKVRSIDMAFDLPEEPEQILPESASKEWKLPIKDEKTIYSCKIEREKIDFESIHSSIERNMLNNIVERTRIDLDSLVEIVKEFLYPLDIIIDHDFVKQRLEKYIAEGIVLENIIN